MRKNLALLVTLMLLLSLLPWSTFQRSTYAMKLRSAATPTFNEPPQTAMQAALEAYIQDAHLPYGAEIITYRVEGDWAYGLAGYIWRDTGESVPMEAIVILARLETDGLWKALVPSYANASEYNKWLDSIPSALLSPEDVSFLRFPERLLSAEASEAADGYRLPWADGWRATKLQGPYEGTHVDHGIAYWAVDFNLWGGDWGNDENVDSWIVAAKTGTVVYVKDCDWGHDSWKNANTIVIGHGAPNAEGQYPEYSWYVHLAKDSVPDYIQPRREVKAGAVIGQEGDNGLSSGVHLHFMVSDWFPPSFMFREEQRGEAPWPVEIVNGEWHHYAVPVQFEEENIDNWPNGEARPSENHLLVDNSVVLYWDADYHGPAIRYARDNVDERCSFDSSSGKFLCNIPSFLNERISSIQVKQEGRIFVKLHQDANGNGYSRGWWWTEANFDNDYYDAESAFGQLMHPLNDSISSLFIDCDPCGDGSSAVTNENSAATQNLSPGSEPPLPLCGGGPTPPPTDSATFLTDVTLPDGTVVSPGQALHKVWRVRNSGTSTWGSGYQLVFVGGDQMGAPSAVDVPGTVSPDATVDLAVDMTAPTTPGTYTGRWRLRNAQGVYFGDELWIAVTVPGDAPPSEEAIELTCTDCPAVVEPGQTFRPTVHAHVNSGELLESRGDMLRNTDGNLYGAWPHVAVEGTVNAGQTYDFTFYADNPITAPDSEGTYETKWRVWRDGHWDGEEITIRFEVQSSGGTNYPPNPPTLTGPGDWAVFQGEPVILTVQHNGDPDGDAITGYYFDLMGPNPTNSGWIGGNTWNPQGLPYSNYEWRVKVRDSQGNESDWSSQTWHFNVLNNEPEIYEFYSTTCRDAWGGAEKICFCAKTNAGTLQLQVNTATDGSDQGEWRIINELGVPEYRCQEDSDRPPNTHKLEWETGTHRARLYARREGGWENAAYQDITFSLPAERRPNDPEMLLPAYDAYVNSRTVRFDWKDTLRTTDYHLEVSTDPAHGTKLVDEHLGVGASEYTYAFDSDYETLYWRVKATGPYGTNGGEGEGSRFHIDLSAPSSAVTALPAVTTDTAFAVNWGGSDGRSGLRWYDVQFRDGERGEWVTWMAETTLTSALFRGEPGHVYYFRVRAMDEVGNWETYPAGGGDTHTLVDPSAAPPTAWWDDAYDFKRNIVVLNNDDHTMPTHYPVHLHFDSSTTPTAEEIYNASQSTVKGDDFRIVYGNTTELDRHIQSFSPTEIKIWFPLQADLSGLQTSEGDYQFYYGDPSATSPPADVNAVFLPEADANTVLLAHFQEGSGSTVYDSSGRSHNGSFTGAGWTDGYLGWAGLFNGSTSVVNFGNHTDFDLGAMTLETWILVTEKTGKYERFFDKETYRFNFTGSRQPQYRVFGNEAGWSCPTLELNRWYHLAATYNGSDRGRIYINGQRCSERIESHTPYHTAAPLLVGTEQHSTAPHFPGYIQHIRISNIERTSFPYAKVDIVPSVEAGASTSQPGSGTSNLTMQGLTTYPSESGGVIVQAVVRNEGDGPTTNGFYIDLYADHLPSGAGDYTGSLQFWIASPIQAGATVTLTTVLTDVTGVGGASAEAVGSLSETSTTLYAQADSTGVISEPNDADNISTGTEVCVASADVYESDDITATAQSIAVGETQTHNFDALADEDWTRFTASGGVTYTIQTSELESSADTYLYLYDADGSKLLAANDDYGGSLASRIDWTAPVTDTYYVLVKHWNPNVGGCGTAYDLAVMRALTNEVFLPVTLRSYP